MSIHRAVVATPEPPLRGHLPFGDARIEVTSRWIEVDGTPVIPVGGEIHFTRVPPEQWAASLRRMAEGGVTVVTTYAIWNHHEQPDGTLSFAGAYDLRAFVRLARQEGLEVLVRLGPYAHGEVRRGGLPDRLFAPPGEEGGMRVRSDDPRYLAEVEPWFAALAEQLAGIPLFGLQIENELYDDPQHLRTLKAMAQRLGLAAPLWTGTAWGGANLPADELLPLFAGYSDAFWIGAEVEHDPASAGNFAYSDDRDEVGVGADTRDVALTPSELDLSRYPYATCELGGGMVGAYHRRPFAAPRDVAALALTKLGSGSVWQGYYMYSDGRNPRRELQESHATGARNDFPELGYDFGAPLAVDGFRRESWYRLRLQHGLLRDFGARLATMPATFPLASAEAGALRWAVRSDGRAGFVFVTNHEPGVALPSHRGVVLEVEVPDGTVTFPAVDIPSGAAFVWPFRLAVGDAELVTATAQPFGLSTWRGLPLLLLAAQDGIPAMLDWTDAARDLAAPAGSPAGSAWGEVRRGDDVLARWVVLPEPDALLTTVVFGSAVRDGSFLADDGWQPTSPGSRPAGAVAVTPVRAAGAAPAVRLGPLGRASAPDDWASAAHLDLELPEPDGSSLVLDWTGDVARLFDGEHLVADAFYTGREWRVPAADLAGARRLRVEILPLPADAPVRIGLGRADGATVTAARWEAP